MRAIDARVRKLLAAVLAMADDGTDMERRAIRMEARSILEGHPVDAAEFECRCCGKVVQVAAVACSSCKASEGVR